MSAPGLAAPRIRRHKCSARTTTATARASKCFEMASAMSAVSRSCSCGRRANTSTVRAILLSPTTRPLAGK